MKWFISALCRRKELSGDLLESPLRRNLNTCDISLLGIGAMVGAGIFVLTGTAVREIAGPATIVSYLIAGLAASLSSFCYAEFGAHIPRAGSAYTYTYVTICELVGFIVGWNVLLEYLLSASTIARAWSASFDIMFNFTIKNGIIDYIGEMDVAGFSDYPDFLALIIIVILVGTSFTGAKLSLGINNFFTILNALTIVMIIVMGFILGDVKNITQPDGFAPFGVSGVFAGAASCFFAFVGFESIATSGEEVMNPSKAIPVATIVSMAFTTTMYVCCATALTVMVPYDTVNIDAAFPDALEKLGIHWGMYVVAIGALFGITTSLTASIFALPRAVYAMAEDGLLFKQLAFIHPGSQVPILASIVFNGLAAIMALLFDIDTLVEFLSIGTLISYTIVAAAIILIRFQSTKKFPFMNKKGGGGEKEDEVQMLPGEDAKLKKQFQSVTILQTKDSDRTITILVVLLLLYCAALAAVLTTILNTGSSSEWWQILVLIISILGIATCMVLLVMFEENKACDSFMVPCVPFTPVLCIVINLCLLFNLRFLSWVRFFIWLAIGLFIYFIQVIRRNREVDREALSKHQGSTNYGTTEEVDARTDEKELHPNTE